MVPYVPFTPLFGILINYYLFAQLSTIGLILITSYIAFAISFYYGYGYKHSVGNNTRWAYLFVQYLSRNSSINSVKDLSRQNSIQPSLNSQEQLVRRGNTSPSTGLNIECLAEGIDGSKSEMNSVGSPDYVADDNHKGKSSNISDNSNDSGRNSSGVGGGAGTAVYSPIPHEE